MPRQQVDPARLEGDALRRWYLRSPEEIEEQRRLAAAERYAEFFDGSPARARQTNVAQAPRQASTGDGGGARYGNLHAPPPENLAELRRQQAALKRTTREISRQNSWMAIPALAPAAAVLGVEAAAALAARFAAPAVARAPLVLTERMPYLRVGDNWATRAGRRVHTALRQRVAQKPGWEPEPTVRLVDGRLVRPDVRTPARVRSAGREPEPFQMELKPNTPSGRRAGARALKKYQETGVKTRLIFYDQKPFI